MKIGVNVKKIYETVMAFIGDMLSTLGTTIANHETRITTLENSEWVKLTSGSGNIEINQEFSEIKMVASVYDTENHNYCFTCNYDSNIFHNSTNRNAEYFITGNPIANNYGCKFKYSVSQVGKQYISVDSCYNGNNTVDSVLEVWIKPVQSGTQ